MVMCLYPKSFNYLVHAAEVKRLKPERLKLAASEHLNF